MTYEPMQPACAPGTVPSAGVWPSAEDGLAGWEQLRFTKKNKVLDLPRPQAPLLDTHAHLRSFWGEDKDPVEVLVRAYRAGVRGLVTLFDPVADACEETPDATAFSAWLQDVASRTAQAGAPLPVRYLVGVHPYGTADYTDAVHAQVEAALDDSNLSKLIGAIDYLRKTTQLLVISHQRRTMEDADVLYGVSMQADGVSRVVSQKLDRETGKVVNA